MAVEDGRDLGGSILRLAVDVRGAVLTDRKRRKTMRVNVYAEEMTDRIEIIGKEIDGHTFTGLRFYLELPVTVKRSNIPGPESAEENPTVEQVRGPFEHRPGDDDSGAVTFWGKQDMRTILRKALAMLDRHYETRPTYGPRG